MAAIDLPPLRHRLRVYEPDGVVRGQPLYPLNWSVAVTLDDLSSMTLEYLNTAPGAALITAPCEVALELAGPDGVFHEPADCRFINIRQNQDLSSPDVSTKLTMPSYGWIMNKILNIDVSKFNENGNRDYNNVQIAAIIISQITEAQERGNCPGLSVDFTATHDSAGVAWDETSLITIGITAGQSVYTTLKAFSDQGQCDWRMNGRTLQMFKVDTYLNRDKTNNPGPIALRSGRDITAAPDDISWEDLAGRVLLQGNDNTFLPTYESSALHPWGYWEGFMQQGGIVDAGLLTRLGARYLETSNARRAQITREIIFQAQSPLPLLDYRQGDLIIGPDDTAQYDALRAQQITIGMQDGQLTGNLVLGDKFVERDIRYRRTLQAVTRSPSVIGGNGTVPTQPTPPDTSVPSQVIGLTLTAEAFVDTNGLPAGIIFASWTPVTTSTGGSAQQISSYRVQWAPVGAPAGSWYTRTVDAGSASTQIGEHIEATTSYLVQVAAVGTNGIQGAYSDPVEVFVGQDTEAPPVPSTPIISTRLGTLRVHWDGRDEDDLNMPADFVNNEVEMASAESGPYTVIGTISSSEADLIVLERPYGVPTFFRMRSRDASGNLSAYSDVASGIPAQVGTGDLVVHSITADLLAVGSVTAEAIAAYSIDATRLSIGGPRNLVNDPNFTDSVLAGIRITNAAQVVNSASLITWSYESQQMYRARLNTNTSSAVGRIGLFASSVVNPNLASGAGIIPPNQLYPVDRSMGQISMRSGISISLASGSWPSGASVTITQYCRFYKKDGTITTLIQMDNRVFNGVNGGFVNYQGTGQTVPSDAVAVLPYWRVEFTNCTTAVLVDLATPFVGQANPGVLIEDGSVTADKIVANAITTTQLDANAITAKHTITGAIFQTATSGTRVVISNTANYLNQPGIRLSGGGSATSGSGSDTSVFQADASASGGWTAFSFVVVGPNDGSGRADINLRPGGSFAMGKAGVNMNAQYATIESGSVANELLLGGSIPRGTELSDTYGAFRFFSTSVATGGLTWPVNVGWTYQGSLGINGPTNVARYASITAASSSAVSWISSGTIDLLYAMLYRGGVIY